MNMDILSGIQGGAAGLLGGYEGAQKAEEDKAKQAALNQLKSRELDTMQAHQVLTPEEAQVAAKNLGMEWPMGSPMSAAALMGLAGAQGHKLAADTARIKASPKFDAAASRVKNEAIAKQHFGLDTRLPVPEESQAVVNSYVENLMKADAKTAGVQYSSPTDVAAPTKKGFFEGWFGGGTPAPAAAPAAAPAGDGWTVKPK